jgi:hypothetical protein
MQMNVTRGSPLSALYPESRWVIERLAEIRGKVNTVYNLDCGAITPQNGYIARTSTYFGQLSKICCINYSMTVSLLPAR